jgi:formate dehydrogenase major subunit
MTPFGDINRRVFFRFSAASLAASSLGALGFGAPSEAQAAAMREFKLSRAKETRNTCTSVRDRNVAARN